MSYFFILQMGTDFIIMTQFKGIQYKDIHNS